MNCWHKRQLLSVIRNEDNCWSDVCKCVKRWKGNRDIIPVIKDHNGTNNTDTTEKANILNSYQASVFCCDHDIREIKLTNSGETFIINTKSSRGLSGYRTLRQVADSRGPVLVAGLSLNKINRRPWTNSPTPRRYVWLALIRAEGVNGTWVMCL
jgi:hypothetical protein